MRALGIDLDGTLVDTALDLAHATNLTLAELGLPAQDAALLESYIGRGMANLLRRGLQAALDAAPTPELLERAIAIFRRQYAAHLCDHSAPYAGVVPALTQLRQRGLKLACITNKPAEFTLPLLERCGLQPLLDFVVSGDSFPAKKPDPLPLTETAKYFRVSPAELLIVGDSENDVQAARAAGCPVLVVPYGYRAGRAAEELGADAVISGLDRIADFLQNGFFDR